MEKFAVVEDRLEKFDLEKTENIHEIVKKQQIEQRNVNREIKAINDQNV